MLSGVTLLITAGPTHEPIDPVRYIGNRSSGKMGFALAQAAVESGATVYLIAGPVNLPSPKGVVRIDVQTADEMWAVVAQHLSVCDIFIGAAAVADYRPVAVAQQKIKKTQASMSIDLVKTPDIIQRVAASKQCRIVVGFAAESEHVIEHARDKLERKKLDMIIANDISNHDYGFASDANKVTVLTHNTREDIKPDSKYAIAKQLIKRVEGIYEAQCSSKDSQ